MMKVYSQVVHIVWINDAKRIRKVKGIHVLASIELYKYREITSVQMTYTKNLLNPITQCLNSSSCFLMVYR